VRVGAISVVTNLAAGLSDAPLDHTEVQAAADAARERVERLVAGWVERIGAESAHG
jgi:purine-nucleoside phosphorylase